MKTQIIIISIIGVLLLIAIILCIISLLILVPLFKDLANTNQEEE